VRLRFQQQLREDFTGAIERITGHEVLTYQSQVLFDPDHVSRCSCWDLASGRAEAALR